MPKKVKKKKLSSKKIQKGTVGNFFVFGVLALLIVLGITAVGGLPPQSFPNTGTEVNVVTPTQAASHSTLQLQTFGYVTIAPTPTPGSGGGLCKEGGVNDEPEIIAGYSPAPGQSVGTNGQIYVWVSDEGAPFIAPNEQVNASTGQVTTPGDRTAKAPDNYLWEPSLYIAPQTAESGGTPHFPNYIKGQYNNTPPELGNVVTGATADPIPQTAQPSVAFVNGGGFFGAGFNAYTAEYIWNVNGLGLSAGSYQAEFLIFDGDRNRGVGCVSFTIQ
jgi:hypothetical protein